MKILLLDIETSPNVAHVWQLFNQNVSLSQLRESSFTMCFAAKWYRQKGTHFFSYHNDGRENMLDAAWDLLNQADAVVTYNGNRFDIPTLNKEFVLQDLAPPAPYKSIDLYRVVAKQFRFPSGKLAYVADALGIGGKVGHEGHELWVKCLAGDAAAWRKMEQYNKQDVHLLEPLYDRLIPWITNHPNLNLYDDTLPEGCPNCGCGALTKQGFTTTGVGRFQRFKCSGCGTWSRSTKRIDGTTITQEKF